MLQSSSTSSTSATGVSQHEEFQFRLASTCDEMELCKSLRQAIFVQEQKVPEEAEVDGKDDQAFHIVCYVPDNANASGESSSSLVATGRVLIVPALNETTSLSGDHNGYVSCNNSPTHAILGRIAVRADHRGKGIGRRIVQELERIARSEGAVQASLTPHHYLERFYASLGYSRTPNESRDEWIWINEYCKLISMEKNLL